MKQRQILIYAPFGTCDDNSREQITARFPSAEFTSRWVDGAVMWQDALEGRLGSPSEARVQR